MDTWGQSHTAIQLHVHTAIRHYGHIITSLFLNTTIRIQRCTTTWLQLWRSTLTVLHGIAGDCYMSMWLYGYMAQRQYDSVAARLYSCTTCANDCITGIARKTITWHVVWRSSDNRTGHKKIAFTGFVYFRDRFHVGAPACNTSGNKLRNRWLPQRPVKKLSNIICW